MTAPAYTQVVDPTGLGGERVCRLTPDGADEVVELWVYPTTRDFEAIADAWHRAGGRVSAERFERSTRYVRVTRAT